jgi:hypothetical protein
VLLSYTLCSIWARCFVFVFVLRDFHYTAVTVSCFASAPVSGLFSCPRYSWRSTATLYHDMPIWVTIFYLAIYRLHRWPLNKIVKCSCVSRYLSLSMPVDDSPCKHCGQVFPYSDTPGSFCSKCEAIATEQIDSPGYIAINVHAS